MASDEAAVGASAAASHPGADAGVLADGLKAWRRFAWEALSRRIHYGVLVPVAVLSLSVPFLLGVPALAPLFKKSFQEIVGPTLIGLAWATGVAAWLRTRHAFFAWYSVLLLGLFCRELHFDFAGREASVGVLAICTVSALGYALVRFPVLEGHLRQQTVISCLFATFVCYFLSQALDNRWFRWPPKNTHWRSHTEECLESLGHFFMLLSVWGTEFWRRLG